jgi:hypothetical protein
MGYPQQVSTGIILEKNDDDASTFKVALGPVDRVASY